jgi:RNA polymerase sigma-70 factor (ECF subfamily)
MADPLDPISPGLERTLARCAESVRYACRRHGLAGSDVDEVFQEVRIRLWRALTRGERIEAAPASYVYRAAASAAVDLIRRRRARPEDPMPDAVMDATATPAGSPEHTELLDAVERAVEAITPSRRPVVRMYLAGYRQDEIAGLMGWSEPKTRNLLYRGLADLRERLVAAGLGPEAVS